MEDKTTEPDCPIEKNLRDFIDHVIVPTLEEQFVREQQADTSTAPVRETPPRKRKPR